jgi:2Fe-2S ferredoxin
MGPRDIQRRILKHPQEQQVGTSMPRVTFTDCHGSSVEVEIAEGLTLMEGARHAGIEAIVADCGGACACATCHVYIDDEWRAKLEPRSENEADMLEFAAAEANESSRLSCQITLTAQHDGLRVRTPDTQG